MKIAHLVVVFFGGGVSVSSTVLADLTYDLTDSEMSKKFEDGLAEDAADMNRACGSHIRVHYDVGSLARKYPR